MQLGDARKLDQRTQEALRQRAVLPVLLVDKGATHMEAALAVGVHRRTVSRWCGAFRRNGASGIFIDFMKRLVKDAKQKVFLIVDNLRVHHAKAVSGLAGAPQGRDRDFLSSSLCAGAQPG
jgi:Homeodomain-like domain